jgi:hypothetical protein
MPTDRILPSKQQINSLWAEFSKQLATITSLITAFKLKAVNSFACPTATLTVNDQTPRRIEALLSWIFLHSQWTST